MARAIWKGSISFGLVNIPVALYPATRQDDLKFRLLRKSDLSPVNYKRVAEKDGKEVPWEQIVKGYEYEKGKYVVLKRMKISSALISRPRRQWRFRILSMSMKSIQCFSTSRIIWNRKKAATKPTRCCPMR
jgi:non-homologous end joining protein Ku